MTDPLPLSDHWQRIATGHYRLGPYRMVWDSHQGGSVETGWFFSAPEIRPTYVGDTFAEAAARASQLLKVGNPDV